MLTMTSCPRFVRLINGPERGRVVLKDAVSDNPGATVRSCRRYPALENVVPERASFEVLGKDQLLCLGSVSCRFHFTGVLDRAVLRVGRNEQATDVLRVAPVDHIHSAGNDVPECVVFGDW